MTENESYSIRIISKVGEAKSQFIESINLAKNGGFSEAKAMFKEGSRLFTEGHKVHMELLTKESNNEFSNLSLLLIHAEDQLNSAETLEIIAKDFIDLYEMVNSKIITKGW